MLRSDAKPWKQLLVLGDAILQRGGLQKDLRAEFGDTRGQKLYYLLCLAKQFPNCGILNLCEKHIEKLDFTKLIRFGNRTNAKALIRIQKTDRIAGTPITSKLTESELQEWIREQGETKNKPRKSKTISETDVPIQLKEAVLNAVIERLKEYLTGSNIIEPQRCKDMDESYIHGIKDAIEIVKNM